jgi:hypothetical protein
VAGLALVGHHLKRLDPLFKRLDAQWPCRGGLPPSTLLRSYVGLLAQSKSQLTAPCSLRHTDLRRGSAMLFVQVMEFVPWKTFGRTSSSGARAMPECARWGVPMSFAFWRSRNSPVRIAARHRGVCQCERRLDSLWVVVA